MTKHVDANGESLLVGDMVAGPRDSTGFRFVYLISRYDGSYRKPYIFRQMGDGELEVVGRSNVKLDLSKFTKVDI